MDKITESREATQPIKSRTGGSTFKNPPGHKAWQLIDAAGCRGLIVGDAQVSELHCNFLINLGGATAADIETLGETVRTRVQGEFRRRAGMGDQADRRCGLSAVASPRAGFRVTKSVTRGSGDFDSGFGAKSFLSRAASFAVRIAARAGFTFGRQRVSLKSDSRSGSDAQQRSDPDRRRRARRGLASRLRWRARASACACSSRRRSSASSATASSSAPTCFRCSTGSASPTRCWRRRSCRMRC